MVEQLNQDIPNRFPLGFKKDYADIGIFYTKENSFGDLER